MLPIAQAQEYIIKHSLFEPQNRILLAVSGGKDSVVMAHLFKQMNVNFGIAHCNFNLRATEASRDENFVKQLANDLKVAFYVQHFDTQKYANTKHISTQMAARELRYQWFEKIRVQENYDFIALAHHKNDVMETMLLNLTRGTGIAGLHGIFPKKDKLIRPILFLSHWEISNIITENKFDYVEDSSNTSAKYARNKIRLNVIPTLEQLNPNVVETFHQNAERFLETEQAIAQLVKITQQKICSKIDDQLLIDLHEIKQLKPQKLLLFEILKPYHFTDTVVDDILHSLNKQTGTRFLSSHYCASINRNHLVISSIQPQQQSCVFVQDTDKNICLNQHHIHIRTTNHIEIENTKHKAFVDADTLIYPLKLRFWQIKDKFNPLGMTHTKKLSDFFIDNKIPLHQKNNIPILINGNDEIIWVVGLRQDNRYKITSKTNNLVIFELKK